MDLFVAPTLGFDLLYAFIIVRLARRDLVWINVTPHPTADWIARVTADALDALGRTEEANALRERYGVTEPEKAKPS